MPKARLPVSVAPFETTVRPALWPTERDAPEAEEIDIDALADLADTLDGLLNISDQARKKLSQPIQLKQDGTLASSFQAAMDSARGNLSARLLTAIEKWRDQNHSREERLYVITQLEAQDTDLLARCGLLDAFDVFEAASFEGDLSRMCHLHDTLDLSSLDGWQACLDRALAGAASSCDILEGEMSSTASNEVAAQLLAWGANPNTHAGQVWRNVLDDQESEMVKAFLDHGADVVPLLDYIGNIDIQDGVFGQRYFGKLDEQTLLEITFLPKRSSTARFTYDSFLRTIYAFDRARVIEIVQTDSDAGSPSGVTTRELSELPAATIRDRHARLCALGGKPVELESIALGDPKRTALFKPRTP